MITPNDVDVTLVFGAENCTVLNALSASMRNCAVTLRPELEVLEEREVEVAHAVGAEHRREDRLVAERKRRRLAVDARVEVAVEPIFTGPLSLGSLPLLFGCVRAPKMPAVLFAVIDSGVPDWIVVMPLNCQPPTIALTSGEAPDANRRLRPNGSS